MELFRDNGCIITWMLYQLNMYSNKVIHLAGKNNLNFVTTPFIPILHAVQGSGFDQIYINIRRIFLKVFLVHLYDGVVLGKRLLNFQIGIITTFWILEF